jgi:hypothetical protein
MVLAVADAGVGLEAKDANGLTAFLYACKKGDPEIATAMVEVHAWTFSTVLWSTLEYM